MTKTPSLTAFFFCAFARDGTAPPAQQRTAVHTHHRFPGAASVRCPGYPPLAIVFMHGSALCDALLYQRSLLTCSPCRIRVPTTARHPSRLACSRIRKAQLTRTWLGYGEPPAQQRSCLDRGFESLLLRVWRSFHALPVVTRFSLGRAAAAALDSWCTPCKELDYPRQLF